MEPTTGRRNTVPSLIDDAIEAVADIEQARADASNHRRLADFHASRATRIERVIDGKVIVAAEALAALRARRRLLMAVKPPDEPVSAEAVAAGAEAAATLVAA